MHISDVDVYTWTGGETSERKKEESSKTKTQRKSSSILGTGRKSQLPSYRRV